MDQPQGSNSLPPTGSADLPKLLTLLKAKDDTQRFVGLALLKSVLDSSSDLRQDEKIVQSLWDSLSTKFLDRLIRTGSKPSKQNSKEMLDLVVSVLHIFAILLPDRAGSDPKFLDRIPGLIGAILYSSEETTNLILQLLHTLVSSRDGASAFIKVDDITPLTEIASTHPPVLDILAFAWLNTMTSVQDTNTMRARIDETIQSLVASFTGTDAVTLLEFLGYLLRNADSKIIPARPKWLKSVVGYIQSLVVSRPTPEARSAYTNAAAALLQSYPDEAPDLMFTGEKHDEKPVSFLLINLLLIDIRSSAPVILEQLNQPEYPKTSQRLASAFQVISIFIGHLVRSLDGETFIMPIDHLFKLRKGISETMSVTIEYLRDRWDASVAGAMGLHPDARVSEANTSTGSHLTLAWDSKKDNADQDMFILSAIRALALWLREEENDQLRKETTGLMDMFMDLYQSSSPEKLDFRSPILVALEGITTLEKGRESLISNNGWQVLTKDLVDIMASVNTIAELDASRGVEIVRVLLPLVEAEVSGISEDWMNLITTVAAWRGPRSEESRHVVLEFEVVVLQLCVAVLVAANSGMRLRYEHSISAIRGIAHQLKGSTGGVGQFGEEMEDVLVTLEQLDAA